MARPFSAQSRRAWGSVADGGAINPALDDDDLMPAAMESDVYASKPTKPIAPSQPEPRPTGCWATFTRGLRGKTTTVVNFMSRFHSLSFFACYWLE